MAVGKKTGGRKKGSPNKLTASVKDMIMGALEDVGGIEYLKAQSISNPTAFMQLVGKVIPLTLGGSLGLQVSRIERIIVDPKD